MFQMRYIAADLRERVDKITYRATQMAAYEHAIRWNIKALYNRYNPPHRDDAALKMLQKSWGSLGNNMLNMLRLPERLYSYDTFNNNAGLDGVTYDGQLGDFGQEVYHTGEMGTHDPSKGVINKLLLSKVWLKFKLVF